MSTPLLCAAMLTAAAIAAASGASAAITEVTGQGTVVTTAGSTASLSFRDAGHLEIRLDGSTLSVEGRVSKAGSLALTVDGKAVPLPEGAVDLRVEPGRAGRVIAVVTQGTASTATLTFTRDGGRAAVSASVTSSSGSSSSVSTSTSTAR